MWLGGSKKHVCSSLCPSSKPSMTLMIAQGHVGCWQGPAKLRSHVHGTAFCHLVNSLYRIHARVQGVAPASMGHLLRAKQSKRCHASDVGPPWCCSVNSADVLCMVLHRCTLAGCCEPHRTMCELQMLLASPATPLLSSCSPGMCAHPSFVSMHLARLWLSLEASHGCDAVGIVPGS